MMKKLNFRKTTINPAELIVHPLLSELGYDYKPTEYFTEMLKENGLYERIIITEQNQILSNCADVLAAAENGETTIDVCQVNFTEMQIRFLILHKHKYHVKNLFASYKTAKFLRTYLTEDPEGLVLANSLLGDINVKIAHLMHTSDSTIKRLLRVGDERPSSLGLIDEGHTSFKEVLDKIKLEHLKNKSSKGNRDADGQDQSNSRFEEANSDAPSQGTMGLEDAPSAPNLDKQEQKASSNAVNFEPGISSIEGYPAFSFNITSNNVEFFVDGKRIKKLVLDRFIVRETEDNGRAETFVISDQKHNGFYMSLTIQNMKKAA